MSGSQPKARGVGPIGSAGRPEDARPAAPTHSAALEDTGPLVQAMPEDRRPRNDTVTVLLDTRQFPGTVFRARVILLCAVMTPIISSPVVLLEGVLLAVAAVHGIGEIIGISVGALGVLGAVAGWREELPRLEVSASRIRLMQRTSDHIFPQITWRDLGPITSLHFRGGRLWMTGPRGDVSLICNPLPPRRARKLRDALAPHGWIVEDSDPTAP